MADVVMMLQFGLGGSLFSLLLLFWVRHRKQKLQRSVSRYEKIKEEIGE